MSDDGGLRPKLSRYNSVMPSPAGAYIGESAQGSEVIIPWRTSVTAGRAGSIPRQPSPAELRRLVPPGYKFVGMAANGIRVVKIGGPSRGSHPTIAESDAYVREQAKAQAAYRQYAADVKDYNVGRFTRGSETLNGVQVEGGEATEEQTQRITEAADVDSIFGPLGIDSKIDPSAQFIFDHAAPLTDIGTGARTGVLESHGIFGSADSMERQLPAGRDVTSAPSTNMMTVGAVVKWFRGLSVRDKGAYAQMLVLLRNAGYLSGADEELPMGGYTTAAGIAIAEAANDLSQSNAAGDERTMMEYLNDRGSAYSDYLEQQAADQAKQDEYQPVDRQYADPASLKAAAYDAARAAIGRKLTAEEEQRLEAAFRAKEDSAYDQIDEAGRAETAYAVAPPDIGGQVDDFLDGDEFELERKRVLIGDYANEFMRMMGVPG